LLTNKEECLVTEEEWENRDTLIITGSDLGMILLAELLLNISNPKQENNEFDLECENGFRGIGPGSVEVKFWLPGSIGWNGK